MLETGQTRSSFQKTLEPVAVPTRVQDSTEMRRVARLNIRRTGERQLEKGRIVIFAGGTGNPYFSTDTTAA